jgi:hypothetical protein
MGNEFGRICLLISDIDAKKGVARLFIDKYCANRDNSVSTYVDCVNSIKKSHSTSAEKIAREVEFIGIWKAIISYDLEVAKHNEASRRPKDHRRSFYEKYISSTPEEIRASINAARQERLREARDKEFVAGRVFVAARDARIIAEGISFRK